MERTGLGWCTVAAFDISYDGPSDSAVTVLIVFYTRDYVFRFQRDIERLLIFFWVKSPYGLVGRSPRLEQA
jgi:hypothetical protein